MNLVSRLYNIVGLLLFGSSIFGCKKDHYIFKEEIEHCECQSIPNSEAYSSETNFIEDTNIVYYATYNPQNNNEFIYVNKIAHVRYLYRYNKVSDEKQFIGSFPKILSVDWGRNDWILLEIGDRNIWKMKSNGDSLTQLTTGRPYFHFTWNYDATKIMTYYYNSNESYTEILNSQGHTLDSLGCYKMYEICRSGNWNNNIEYIVGSILNEIRIIDPNKKIIISEIPFSEYIKEIVWLNNTTAIFINAYGLYRLDINSFAITKLRCQCPNVMYQRLKPNSSGTKLLMTKITYNQIDMNSEHVKVEIVELDLASMNETTIELN